VIYKDDIRVNIGGHLFELVIIEGKINTDALYLLQLPEQIL
jgi:hypothetical protein